MKKILPLLCAIAMIAPVSAWSSDGNDGHNHFGNQAVREYIKEHVMPVLLEKRQVLERELTGVEKSEIAEYRANLKQLRTEQHDNWSRGKATDPSAAPSDQQKAQRSAFHQQMKEIMQKLQAIADKHSNTLNDIKTQLEPVHKQWQQDIAQLRPAKTTESDKSAYPGRKNNFEHISLDGHFARARFLLLSAQDKDQTELPGSELKSDAVTPVPASSTDPSNPGVSASAAFNLSAFQVMPNPASNEIITGNEPLPAQNQFALIDIQGKRALSLENVQAAQHIDISQLAAGTYILELKSADQTVNRQLVITR